MQKFTSYILIGFGIYFLFNEFNIPLIHNLNSITAILFIIGFLLLLNGFQTKQSELIIPGTILFGLAIHLYGLSTYPNWIDHWAIYIFIIGIGLLLNYLFTKNGLLSSVVLIFISVLFMFVDRVNDLFQSFFNLFGMGTTYWPLIFIGLGIFLFRTKK